METKLDQNKAGIFTLEIVVELRKDKKVGDWISTFCNRDFRQAQNKRWNCRTANFKNERVNKNKNSIIRKKAHNTEASSCSYIRFIVWDTWKKATWNKLKE